MLHGQIKIVFLNMQFDYEIPVEQFAAAQMLYHTARGKMTLIKRALVWILLGLFLLSIAVFRWADMGPLLLFLSGAWFIYCGTVSLFPRRYFRRAYPQSGLAGKNYHAELDENGFLVTGDSCSWRVLWSEAELKGEDEQVFMFNAKATLFIFGKKYLTDEQQKEIRRFAAIS